MNFETALRQQIEARPRKSMRDRKILAVLDGPKNEKRAKKLAKWESHARLEAGFGQTVTGIDWSKVDWKKLIENILAIIALFL